MSIKYIITILWIGLLPANLILAQDIYSDNQKAEPSQAALVPETKTKVQEDSVKFPSPGEDMPVYLPFVKSTTKITAGDITVINPEEMLNYDNVITITDALSGRVPGSYGGVNLRGLGNALIVIDGIPRLITEVTLREVEQITILKDANAAMLYGVQANNGVILITTKRGQAFKNKITALVETGFGKPISYPKYLRSADYMELYNEALANDGLVPLYTQTTIDETRNRTNPTKYPDADYYNSTFLKSYKPFTRVETEFSGGNNNAQFYANAGWQRSGSIYNLGEAKPTDRLNLRSNLNFRINDYINSHIDIATIFNIANSPAGNFFSDATTLKPNYYPPLIDTLLVANKKLVKTALLAMGGNMLGGTSLYRNNIYGNLIYGGYNRQINTTGMFNAGLDFDLKFLLEGLVLKTWASFSFYNQFSETQTNTYAVYEPRWLVGSTSQDSLALTKIGLDRFEGTLGIANTSLARDYSFYGMLDYSHTFGEDHALSMTLLGYFDKYNVTGTFQTDKHSHLGARINYVYNKKYMVNFNSALVSSPKLAPDHRLGFSPSVALGWIISEEDFLKDNSLINYLKLKVSTGIMNTDMSLTRYYSYENILVTSTSYAWGDAFRSGSSTIFSNIANDKLFYEKRKELTIGAEALLLNKSIWIDANLFREVKADQIVISGLSNTYPTFLGGLNPAENYNEEKYSGFELGLSFRKSFNDFSFDIRPSLLFLKTEVVKRDEFYGWDYLYRKGKSTGAIFGLESMGFFQDDADIASHETQMFGIIKPGDIKYKDQNGDGIIDSNDEVMIGDGISNIVGGMTLRLKFKNFSLFALASGRNGAQRTFSSSYYWVYGDLKYSDVVFNRWTPATAATAAYPRLCSQSNTNNFRSSTFWLEENSLYSLERAQLTFDLPQQVVSKLFTKNLSLYLRASNLLNLAENKDKMELNIGSEPQYRYYSFGIKALF